MKKILENLQGIALLLGVIGFVVPMQAAALSGQAGGEVVSRAQGPQTIVKPKAKQEEKPVEQAPKASAKDAIRIGVIDRVELIGDMAFITREDVATLLKERLCDGQEKTIGDLRQATVDAKGKLSARGYHIVYIYPRAADAYDTATKTLYLTVEPALFGKVSVHHAEAAGGWYSEEQIVKRFKHVKEGDPFNYNTLRQAIRSVNAHPDLMADTKLLSRLVETNAAEGAAAPATCFIDTELTVDDSFPLHATLDLNNYAMRELDYWQMLISLQYLNLTGADDVLTVSPGVAMNGDMWSIAASYLRPFDLFLGGSWSVYGGYSDMNSDNIVDEMNLLGFGGFAGLNTCWNLYDDEKRNVAFNMGVMWRTVIDRWRVQGVDLDRRDIQIVPVSIGLSYADKCRDWLGGLDFAGVSQSVNLYGDKEDFKHYSQDPEIEPNYWVLRANWARLQPVYGPSTDGEEWRCWSLFTKIEGQWSEGSTLISPERLAYGGNACLRGYRRYGYLGDSGIYGTIEIRTPVWSNFITEHFVSEDWTIALERIQPFLFTDAGYITYNTTTKDLEEDEFLWSAGFGVRAALTQYLSLNFDFAVPLEKGYADELDRTVELYFSIKLQF